jgi:methionyl-tRNA formyltransferase
VRLPDRRLRVAFFGTPEIAAVVLRRLLDEGTDDVVFCVCQPDKPRGRGKNVEPPPVKALAAERQIEVLQPVKLKDGALAERMQKADLDLAIVVAYGRILPKDVFSPPRAGAWNVHASLLPRHRGASPIQHAILQGDPETGVTLMQLTEGLDEGPMLLERRLALTGTETGGSLTAALADLGAGALIEGMRRVKRSGLEAVPQDPSRATYAPLIDKADGRIDFTRPAVEIERRIRAFSPWPSAFVVQQDGQPMKVLKARAEPGPMSETPGRVARLPLVIETGQGLLEVLELQPPGKKPMAAAEWIRGAGRHVRPGEPLGL